MENNIGSMAFGRYLRDIRIKKDISLDDISQITRILKSTLLIIENEDHAKMPAQIFVKSFLRAYAKIIGADGEKAVSRYEISRHYWIDNARTRANPSRKREKGFWTRLIIGLGLLMVVIASSLYLEYLIREAPLTNTNFVSKGISAHEATGKTVPKTTLNPVTRDKKTHPEKLLLQIVTVEPTWLKVVIDGGSAREYSLKPKDRLALEASVGFNLLIGNARGLNLTFNNKPVIIPGKSQEVVTLVLP